MDENHLAISDLRQNVPDNNLYYLGSPASMGHEPPRPYEQTVTTSEQDMLDCESRSPSKSALRDSRTSMDTSQHPRSLSDSPEHTRYRSVVMILCSVFAQI